ncbi:two-component system sensor histidine kinase NtrB [Rhodopirellula sp. SWK7]|uniref:two-component system sensor histidine kinase NtrB n=1 Tax=Rhodopirellula sp. SWK7 TaxID=595460 RepID=UPI0002BD4D12|nr:PAS domain S-box protein [Rhodopirellula sp. SWK7]EMI43531.1 PAS/PAC sensor signal transduction histidine kinase [Rhodopirellula sp. SWK7]
MKNQQEAVLAALLNTAVDAIIVMDSVGIIRIVNAAMERMFGFSEAEVIGKNVSMLMPSPDHERHDGYLSKYRSGGQRNIIGIGREVNGKRKNGTVFPLHLAVSELKYDGEVLFTGILRDITDLKKAQNDLAAINAVLEQRVEERTEQLREAQSELVKKEKLATLGQVAGGIAHEIRNPLNAVKTSAYFLQHARSLSPEKLTEHLQRIDRQVSVIDNVISALTDVVRMPAPQCMPCPLKEMIDAAIEASSLGDSIQIDNRVADTLPPVFADQNQVPIAFQNLIRNARDAMPSGGRLTLDAEIIDSDGNVETEPNTVAEDSKETRADGSSKKMSVTIADTGSGIDSERLSRIMEPFFSTKARGMGLGLAITKTIVEKNNGTIAVESTLGQGTRFCIVLPIAEEDDTDNTQH